MEIKVPTSWDDVTVKQFDDLVKISNDPDLDIAEREIRLIAVLTGLSVFDTRYLDAVSFQKISNSLSFLNNTPEKKLPVDKIVLNNKEYHVDLFPVKFSAAQFLDYKVLSGEDIDKKTARLLACFVYPLGASYNDGSYDVEDVVNDINEHMSVPEVTGYTHFFMIQYTAYANSLLEYSIRKTKRLKGISKQEKQSIIDKLNKSKALIKSFGA